MALTGQVSGQSGDAITGDVGSEQVDEDGVGYEMVGKGSISRAKINGRVR